MIVLTIKTDQPQAEIGLFKSGEKLAYLEWQAHYKLSETIHRKIEDMLKAQKLSWNSMSGVVIYKGPGSFTGLRIGASVANTLASELNIPIAGANGEAWIKSGLDSLQADPNNRMILPDYGSDARITQPRK